MEWNEMFTQAHQPTYDDIESYIGGKGKELWQAVFRFMEDTYKSMPKMTYSVCSGKPGWNVKFQKSGTAFGTLYPEKNQFTVFMVISYKLEQEMELAKLELSPKFRSYYESADDYMKMGRWMMFPVQSVEDFEDYKKLCHLKMKPKR